MTEKTALNTQRAVLVAVCVALFVAFLVGFATHKDSGSESATQQQNSSAVPVGSPAGEKWADSIVAAAKKHEVDPVPLSALIWQESSYQDHHGCTNGQPDGTRYAAGIAQFGPWAAEHYNVNPCDSENVIPAAANYLADLTRQYKGNVLAALAAYNGGPKYGEEVLAGKIPSVEETANYISLTAQTSVVNKCINLGGCANLTK